ncbi:SH3 domain-containing protein [Anabaena sp. UHCC 0451]|uniref:SH3 domain-containing protein n=1 Tax=Anabaena sp. UHCC 0451 TaxID=2055235 RepID=UPI002B20DE5B|nr:SH3 domain-containing protein [Anabaena sp. UHCC 0451]MEA5577134.1 SH3 domain-containing protein [Anabaena sp. UHCC 0451]
MLSGLLKLILGFLLAIAVLLGSGVTIALYFVNRTAVPPAKPTYANDNPKPKPDKPKVTQAKATSNPKASSTPKPTPTESPQSLPPGAYQATVTWPQGLSVRDRPSLDAKSVSGVAANQKVIILEESQDKNWQKIRVEGSDQEGWVKAGNTKKVEQ